MWKGHRVQKSHLLIDVGEFEDFYRNSQKSQTFLFFFYYWPNWLSRQTTSTLETAITGFTDPLNHSQLQTFWHAIELAVFEMWVKFSEEPQTNFWTIWESGKLYPWQSATSCLLVIGSMELHKKLNVATHTPFISQSGRSGCTYRGQRCFTQRNTISRNRSLSPPVRWWRVCACVLVCVGVRALWVKNTFQPNL